MPLCLMILTDIIEFYKCLKSLSGATAPLKRAEKRERKRGSGGWWWGRNNHSPKIFRGEKNV